MFAVLASVGKEQGGQSERIAARSSGSGSRPRGQPESILRSAAFPTPERAVIGPGHHPLAVWAKRQALDTAEMPSSMASARSSPTGAVLSSEPVTTRLPFRLNATLPTLSDGRRARWAAGVAPDKSHTRAATSLGVRGRRNPSGRRSPFEQPGCPEARPREGSRGGATASDHEQAWALQTCSRPPPGPAAAAGGRRPKEEGNRNRRDGGCTVDEGPEKG
jgi:hypothetical protein